MVKFTGSLLIAGLTLISTSSLAAPVPMDAPESDFVAALVDSGEVNLPKSDEKIEALLRKMVTNKSDMPAILAQAKVPATLSASDKIRRSLPLVDTVKRDGLTSGLGLDGDLSPLGLGGLVSSLEQTIAGLPVIGGPLAGLIGTLDGAVGVSSLLNPSSSAPGLTRRSVKRQSAPAANSTAPAQNSFDSTTDALLELAAASSATHTSLAMLFTQLDDVSSAAKVANSTSLSTLTIAQAESSGLLPTTFAHSLAISLVEHEVESQQTGFARQFMAAASSYKSRNPSDDASSALPSKVAASAGIPTASAHIAAVMSSTDSSSSTPSVSAYVAAAMSSVISSSGAAVATGMAKVAAAIPSSMVMTSASAPIFEAVPSATLSSSSSSQASPDLQAYLEMLQTASGSDYDSDSYALISVGLHHLAAATPTLSSASMPSNLNQAMATAQAMSMTSSGMGSTAAPTTTGLAKRWAVKLD